MDRIVRYGERGVVDALVHSLVENDLSKEFLKKIQWVDDSNSAWIDNVISITWIIEVGLSRRGFGDPDIIMVCITENDDPHFVFIEAKVIQYEKSAISNKLGISERGYNSSINGQLSLKYRFVKALEQWEDGHVIEPEIIHEQYLKHLNEKLDNPRKLAKQEIIENILLRNGFNEASLSKNRKNAFFVALTWDAKPGPFVEIDDEFKPKFIDETGKEIWENLKPQVGWIGYGALVREMNLGEEFESTLKMMVDPFPEPTTIENFKKATIKTINLENFTSETRETCDRILNLFREYYPESSLQPQKGSHSIVFRRKTIVKIIPINKGYEEIILLGFSMSLNPKSTNKIELRGPYLVNQQPFLFTEIKPSGGKGLNQQIQELISLNTH